MKRRMVSALLCAVMAVTMLAGCGNSANTSGGGEQGTEAGSGAADGEIVEILWQYPYTMDTANEGFINMENALNEMMERDIGVHVTFQPVELLNAQNDAILAASSGEQLDIMLTAFTSIGNVVNKGLVLPLDDLLAEYGQDIIAKSHTLEQCGYMGQTYGVTTGNVIANGYSYVMKKEYWDKYNLAEEFGEYSDEKIYTLDEIEKMFEIVKAGEGDNFYCNIPWNDQEPLNRGYIEIDELGGSLACGVLMLNRSFDDLTVYDLFETEEYAEYCRMVYDWAQKGYFAPDAAVTTESPDTLVRQDNYLGMFSWGGAQELVDTNLPCETLILNTIPHYASYNGGAVIQWSLPITCANPEKAMEALNYIYKNKDAAALIQYGIEGQDYEVVQEEGDLKQIRYLSENPQDLPYYNGYGIWGSALEWPAIEPQPLDKGAKRQAYDDAVPRTRFSAAMGYSFDQSPVSSEIAAVNTVIEQYARSFNSGALDPEKALPEFIDALKSAGMDAVIQEQQKQLDEWAAGKAN